MKTVKQTIYAIVALTTIVPVFAAEPWYKRLSPQRRAVQAPSRSTIVPTAPVETTVSAPEVVPSTIAPEVTAPAAPTTDIWAMRETIATPEVTTTTPSTVATTATPQTGLWQSIKNWWSGVSLPSWQQYGQPTFESVKTKWQETVQPKLGQFGTYVKESRVGQLAQEHPYIAGAIGAGVAVGTIAGAYCIYKYKANKSAQKQCEDDLENFEKVQKGIAAAYGSEQSPARGLVNKIITAINQPGALDEFKKQYPITNPQLDARRALGFFSKKAALTSAESQLLGELFAENAGPEIIIIKNSVLDTISRALGYGGLTKAMGQPRELGLGATPKTQPQTEIKAAAPAAK